MTTDRDNSGSAFPQPGVFDAARDQVNPVSAYYDAGGMTLRDYFIAHAPITYQDAIEWLNCYDRYAGDQVGPWKPSKIMETLVRLQNEYADEMLKARAA